MKNNTFEHNEDEQFFANLFTDGNITSFRKKYLHLFDFRDPKIKRNELDINLTRRKLLENGLTCKLNISPDCNCNLGLEVEHLIPISSNKLNVKIRKMKRTKQLINGITKMKKPPTQSLGSNHPDNLVLACKKCNSIKKHRLPDEFPKVVDLIIKKVSTNGQK